MQSSIDLNSDLGEDAGSDAAIMPLITSANIACGGHAGDERTMRETVALAIRYGVAVGAHPGYPDRANFGRLAMAMAMEQYALVHEIVQQIHALRATSPELTITHVKAHGALYNQAERDTNIADAIASAVRDATSRWPRPPLLFAPPGSAMIERALAAGLPVAREGFVDRAYEPDGRLRSRKLPNSLHTDPKVAADQALSFVRDGGVRASDGSFLQLEVDTLCLHGDTPGAVAIAAAVREALADAGISVRAPQWP